MIDERAGDLSVPGRGLEFTEAVIGTAREPMMVLDAGLRVVSANAPFYRAFGGAPEEVEGRPFFDLDGGRWDVPPLRPLLEGLLPDDRTIRNLEVEHAPADGGRRRMRINAGKIWREDEHSELILLAIEEVAGRDDATRGGEMLALIAHEMRTPIAAIRNAVTIAASAEPADLGWCHDVIGRQARKLAMLADDLADADHIRLGRLALRRERVDLDALFRLVIDAVRPLADAKEQVLAPVAAPPGLDLDADPRRLQQILVNLLADVVRSAPPDSRIRVEAARIDDDAILRVRDEGHDAATSPGSSDRVQPIPPGCTVACSAESLGIGVALAKSLVELHGGILFAASGEPRGEFLVRLPASPRLWA
jgi:two-component system CheB/CheR fusion protein